MANRRPRAIGEFSWFDADIGVECLACGRVAVYCDWDALDCFRERGWSLAAHDAIRRFRCRCGARDLRFRPVSIARRPKPVPILPKPLRPIYAEDMRVLCRSAVVEPPDPIAIETALDVLRQALSRCRHEDVRGELVDQALATLRPHCYRSEDLERFPQAIAPGQNAIFSVGEGRQYMIGILRQLGRPPE